MQPDDNYKFVVPILLPQDEALLVQAAEDAEAKRRADTKRAAEAGGLPASLPKEFAGHPPHRLPLQPAAQQVAQGPRLGSANPSHGCPPAQEARERASAEWGAREPQAQPLGTGQVLNLRGGSRGGGMAGSSRPEPGQRRLAGLVRTRDAEEAHAATLASLRAAADADGLAHWLPGQPAGLALDPVAAAAYLYPVKAGHVVRDYQAAIVQTALFHNTLVALPTGLGKTLIAAVVMLNFYRWFPKGKVVFTAPTRPLVEQQAAACHQLAGIPQADACFMTGNTRKGEDGTRGANWARCRVFFVTPQLLANDLRAGVAPAHALVALVVDEAHRASGKYAYTQVVQQLKAAGVRFRLLALSATPGEDQDAVQRVVKNLGISRIEYRDEADVAAYVHPRVEELVAVPADAGQAAIERTLREVMTPWVEDLRRMGALPHHAGPVDRLLASPYTFTLASQAVAAGSQVAAQCKGKALLLLGRCVILARGLETLNVRGMRLAHEHFALPAHAARLECGSILLAHALRDLQSRAAHGAAHSPKLRVLVAIVTAHFQRQEQRTGTRVMVFASSRESVIDIMEELKAWAHVGILPREFIGQGEAANTSGGKERARGQTQAQQRAVVAAFAAGEVNTLVATCIGEEGLDVADVDLIVFFDCVSITRMIQRMGRTGRHCPGAVKILASCGPELSAFQEKLAKFKRLQGLMANSHTVFQIDDAASPRMLPLGLTPMQQNIVVSAAPWVPDAPTGGGRGSAKARTRAEGGGLNALELSEEERALLSNCRCEWTLQKYVHEQHNHLHSQLGPTGAVPHSAVTVSCARILRMLQGSGAASLDEHPVQPHGCASPTASPQRAALGLPGQRREASPAAQPGLHMDGAGPCGDDDCFNVAHAAPSAPAEAAAASYSDPLAPCWSRLPPSEQAIIVSGVFDFCAVTSQAPPSARRPWPLPPPLRPLSEASDASAAALQSCTAVAIDACMRVLIRRLPQQQQPCSASPLARSARTWEHAQPPAKLSRRSSPEASPPCRLAAALDCALAAACPEAVPAAETLSRPRSPVVLDLCSSDSEEAAAAAAPAQALAAACAEQPALEGLCEGTFAATTPAESQPMASNLMPPPQSRPSGGYAHSRPAAVPRGRVLEDSPASRDGAPGMMATRPQTSATPDIFSQHDEEDDLPLAVRRQRLRRPGAPKASPSERRAPEPGSRQAKATGQSAGGGLGRSRAPKRPAQGRGALFIDGEAELSGEDSGDGESFHDEASDLKSFIDDASVDPSERRRSSAVSDSAGPLFLTQSVPRAGAYRLARGWRRHAVTDTPGCDEGRDGCSPGEDDNADLCCACNKDGRLLLCDSCPGSYHLQCLNLALTPEGEWHCPVCTAMGGTQPAAHAVRPLVLPQLRDEPPVSGSDWGSSDEDVPASAARATGSAAERENDAAAGAAHAEGDDREEDEMDDDDEPAFDLLRFVTN